ncbi:MULTISPECIES: DUF349 domain-containing protein [unclassified Arsukibacterium]|uniref:DUF349 domain-containing protein n=1 Tax=unclassified Arsukibacterium TaxID=2635278 RepID=UPI000C388E27|nr:MULTISPECIES: DUF349 domain-containing protein [unclassified Arsukibacterium]MAA96561.1 hypothetical protein [Rheinheimera sp.]MBM33235.1 hypothetical protein [Rheinheimera sp.]HAW91718.1 DUF349 domain-containing protein [Candidatus Azambacteria bacterium]|tara:strand:+ start:37190 stop:39928 length:2739 start_codon:yes stop_codon:yes gene_type:complete
MIFKNWFKPKWQHPDHVVREQAIASLSAGQREHKEILHELAFNDSSEVVRRSALEHLNDFSLWWQASKQDSNDRLRQQAEQQLLLMLLTQQISSQLKRQFIAQCNRTTLLEQLAEQETDAEILFIVLQRLNRPELNAKALTGTVLTIAQKQQLLAQLDDSKQLEKLSKVLSGELAQQLEQKLTLLTEQQQRPAKLRKEITLLLARLNALRERFSAAEIPAQLTELQSEWLHCSAQLGCLPVAEAAGISDKYQQLIEKLESWLAPQLQQLALAQAEAARLAAEAQQARQFTEALGQVSSQLSDALAIVDISTAQAVGEQLNTIAEQITQSNQLNEAQRQRLLQQHSTLANQLTHLPQTAEKLSQASRLVSDWAAQPVPNDPAELDAAKAQLQAYKRHWRDITANLPLAVPEQVVAAKQQLQQQWQQALADANSQAERAVRQCRSKIAQFKRLDQQGRYKVLFGLFKGISADYAALNQAEHQKLAADYQLASSRISELADWQEYIATPRKQEALTHMQQLALTEPTDIPARAEQVKQARQQWGSFGKAGAEQDTELNTAFDTACEQAYAPCRVYFAEQDAIKAANVTERERIIGELTQLAAAQPDAATLESGLKSLTQAWQQAGPVKRQDYVSLQQRFQAALSELKDRAAEFQQQVAEQKQALLNEAKAAVALSDSNQTSKILKELQQRWKPLGYAGKKLDQQLWQQFRKVCDDFFSQRQAVFAEQQQQQLVQEQALSIALSEIAQAVQALTPASSSSELQAINEQLHQLDVGVIATARKQRDNLRQQLQALIEQQASQVAQHDLNTLFSCLDQVDCSSDNWPQQFKPQPELAGALGLDRKGLTQAMEIISEVSGPERERTERQQVQLTLLTLKHNAGEVTDKHSLLKHWLAFGPVAEAELPLVERLKALFLGR